MNWHEFIFSEKTSYRLTRHLVFWLVWGVYFFLSMSILPRQTNAPPRPGYSIWNFSELIHGLLILCIHLIACYTFIYFILPRYLVKAKYLSLVLCTILLGCAMIYASRFVDSIIIPVLKGQASSVQIPYYTSIFSGLASAIKIIAVAAAIKLVKYWWLKEKEKERLEKEKIETELQLLKAEIHPAFLFSTLNSIYSFSLKASAKAPEMLLKLSDILSYMLYDCNDKEVALDKEIKILKDYMSLEKTRIGDKLEMNIQVKGDTRNQQIAPLLLLRFIENSFAQCNDRMTAQQWINLEIELEDHTLHMKLLNGKSPIITASTHEDDNLVHTKRRLQLLYPNNHKLAIIVEAEIMIVSLELKLATSNKSNGQLTANDEFVPADIIINSPLPF